MQFEIRLGNTVNSNSALATERNSVIRGKKNKQTRVEIKRRKIHHVLRPIYKLNVVTGMHIQENSGKLSSIQYTCGIRHQ